MKKSRTTEYIIMDSEKNKDLLTNDIIKLQKVKHKGPPNGDGPKPKTTRELLIEFMNNVYKRFGQQEKFNKFIANRLDKLEQRFDNLDKTVNFIERRINNLIKVNNLNE